MEQEGLGLMFWRCLLTAAAAVGSLHASAALANTNCDTFYEVRRGDTLSKIARRFYGDLDVEKLHQANLGVIGPKPELIEIGARLWIPCEESAAAAAIFEAPATALAGRAPLRVLSGPQRAPLIGPDLPRAGMMGEMLSVIAAEAGFKIETPVHVPVAGSRLAALLSDGGFDIGFPWTKSGCTDEARRHAQAETCGNLLYSEPFYEVEMGMFALRGGRFDRTATLEQLQGARICRPATLALDDLEAVGLTGDAEILRLDTEATCLDQLGAGLVDVVSMDADLGAILLEQLGMSQEVRPLTVATRQMLYAAAPRDHPQGAEIIAAIDRGLERLRLSGQWFTIAYSHLARYPKLVRRVQPRG